MGAYSQTVLRRQGFEQVLSAVVASFRPLFQHYEVFDTLSPLIKRFKNMKKKHLPEKKISALTGVSAKNVDTLYQKVSAYIDQARQAIHQAIDTEMVKAYWFIGRDMVEEEQEGKKRAEYGHFLLNELSERLTKKYGRGFSSSTLRDIRQFYQTYPNKFTPTLSWTHYRVLMRVHNLEARSFYEIETKKNCWSGRELERQVDSLLFERLAKSKDKKGLMRLACKGQEIDNPADAIKEPLVLEFAGLPETHRLVESKLEEALTNNLQAFLLELGKGFAFIARQKRLTLDGDHFYADLVF